MSNEIVDFWQTLIPGFFALAGVGITGLLSYLNTGRAAKEHRDTLLLEKRIERMEDLYALFEAWQKSLGHTYALNVMHLQGKITARQLLEQVDRNSLIPGESVNKMMAIVKLHFPELSDEFQAVDKARSRAAPYLNTESKKNPNELVAIWEAFDESCLVFKENLAELAKKTLRSS